ncbi:MAG: TIGR00730 family Rossman fold protein [Muribaculaceae bacterium]|nr:TIGR00730 family Rossman fold protein [Muribaculaceae bacterium]
MNIAVYCSSRPHLNQDYIDMASTLGQWLGMNGHTLVYGGVNAGLMHIVAKAAHEHGGHITGVVTRNFAPMTDQLVDRLITTANLNERKAQMYLISNLHVVLPGGIGTIDEWISALSQMVVDKREGTGIVVVNADGMYDNIIAQLNDLANTRFAGDSHLKLMRVVADSEELVSALNEIISLNTINKDEK